MDFILLYIVVEKYKNKNKDYNNCDIRYSAILLTFSTMSRKLNRQINLKRK